MEDDGRAADLDFMFMIGREGLDLREMGMGRRHETTVVEFRQFFSFSETPSKGEEVGGRRNMKHET